MHLLIVQDDEAACADLAAAAAQLGWRHRTAADASQAWKEMLAYPADVILLDLASLGRSGIELIARLRSSPLHGPHRAKPSVLFMSSAEDIHMRLEAFNLGADAFVAHPIRIEEILAVLRALVRRRGVPASEQAAVPLLQTQAPRVRANGGLVALTRGEHALLVALLESYPHAASRAVLQAALGTRGSRALDLRVYKLRGKLGRDAVETVRGAGYRLVTLPEAE